MKAGCRDHGLRVRRRQLWRCHRGSRTAAAHAFHVRVDGAAAGEWPHAVSRGDDGGRRGGGGYGAGAGGEHRVDDCRVAKSCGSVSWMRARIIKLWRRPNSATTAERATATGVVVRRGTCRRGRQGWEGRGGGCTAFGPTGALQCLVFDETATKHHY